jgi:hypothetical protein
MDAQGHVIIRDQRMTVQYGNNCTSQRNANEWGGGGDSKDGRQVVVMRVLGYRVLSLLSTTVGVFRTTEESAVMKSGLIFVSVSTNIGNKGRKSGLRANRNVLF